MFQRRWALSARGNFSRLSGACGASFHACFPFVSLQKTNTMTGGRCRVGVMDGGWMDPGHGPVRTDARMSGNLGCIAPSGTRWSAQSHHRKPPANQTKGRGRGGSERKPAWKPKTRPTAQKSRNEAPGQARAQKMEDPRNVPFAHFPSSSASTIPSSSYPPLHRPSCPKLVSRNALGCSVPSGTSLHHGRLQS